MFDDPHAFDGIAQAIVAFVAAVLFVNAIVLALATWVISRWARRRGRRGSRFSAFVVALGVEVFIITMLTGVFIAHRVDATIVGWMLGSAVVLGVGTARLCLAKPAVEASQDAHLVR